MVMVPRDFFEENKRGSVDIQLVDGDPEEPGTEVWQFNYVLPLKSFSRAKMRVSIKDLMDGRIAWSTESGDH